MASRTAFFCAFSVFQDNNLYLYELKRQDILTLNLTPSFSCTSWQAARRNGKMTSLFILATKRLPGTCF